MTTHHDGRLAFYGNKLRPEFPTRIIEIQDEHGKAVIKWGGFDGVDGRSKKETAANARRLVACWNACIGIPDPEKFIESVKTQKRPRK